MLNFVSTVLTFVSNVMQYYVLDINSIFNAILKNKYYHYFNQNKYYNYYVLQCPVSNPYLKKLNIFTVKILMRTREWHLEARMHDATRCSFMQNVNVS